MKECCHNYDVNTYNIWEQVGMPSIMHVLQYFMRVELLFYTHIAIVYYRMHTYMASYNFNLYSTSIYKATRDHDAYRCVSRASVKLRASAHRVQIVSERVRMSCYPDNYNS